jgi:hypothetical protein
MDGEGMKMVGWIGQVVGLKDEDLMCVHLANDDHFAEVGVFCGAESNLK